MVDFLFHVVAPCALLIALVLIVYKQKPTLAQIVLLVYIYSLLAFSSNFFWYFREVHQILSVSVIVYGLLFIIRTGRVHKVTINLVLFIILIAISYIGNEFDYDARAQVINFLSITFVTIALYSVFSTNTSYLYVGREYFITSALILSCFAIVESLLFGNPRAEVSTANPNYLGFFLGVGFCFLHSCSAKKNYWLKAIILLGGIIVTGSRSSLIFPLLVLVLPVVFLRFSGKRILIMFFSLFLLTILSTFTELRLFDTESHSGSDLERKVFSQSALEMVIDDPITGVGWGRYISEYKNYSYSVLTSYVHHSQIQWSSHERRVSHNDFLRIASELGVVAALLSLIFLSRLVVVALRNYQIFPWYTALILGTILFSASHNNMNSPLFWLIIMSSFFISNNKSRTKEIIVNAE